MTARPLAALLALATTTFGVTASAQDEGDDDDAPAPVAAAPAPSTTTIPVPAWSATTGADDVVVLRDGGAIRGLLMEVLPNDHASVKLADGRTAIIPWVLIHHIEQGSHPAKPAEPTTTPSVTSVPNTASSPIEHPSGSVTVHMNGSEKALLQTEHAGAWTTVCTSPCDRTLPLDASYRIDGSGVKTSTAFHLQGKAGDRVTLYVSTASSGAFSGGVTMAVLGGLTATVGFWGLYVVAIANSPGYSYSYTSDGYYQDSPRHHYSYAPWAITAGIGAVVGTVGLVMAIGNEKTKVTQAKDAAKTAKAERLPERLPSFDDRKPAGFSSPQTSEIFSLKF